MKKLILGFAILLAACGDGAPKSYVKISGGGIHFNYRYSEASFILIAQQTYPMPEKSKLEAGFDIPGTKSREVILQETVPGRLLYRFQSQKLFNITKGGEYLVTLRLLDKDGKELDRKETTFISDQDQASLPTKPLVIGPAYTPNPEQ